MAAGVSGTGLVDTGWSGDRGFGGAAAEWSTAYTQSLSRSTAQTARTLKLYQETLECVSQGRLAPSAFQDHFPRFAQARGATYATRLADLGAKFLSDLVRMAGMDSGDAAEPEVPTPRFDAADSARWAQQIAEYAGELNARVLKVYRSQLERVAAGETTPGEVQQHTADFLASRLPAFLQRAGRLYFELLDGLNDLRASYEHEYFEGLLVAAGRRSRDSLVLLRLSAQRGAAAAASLAVANTTGERTQVRCRMTDVRRADGVGPAFVPDLTITPDGLELAPGAEGTLQLSLLLDGRLYEPDTPYVGLLLITGQSDQPIEVQLQITAKQPAGALGGASRP